MFAGLGLCGAVAACADTGTAQEALVAVPSGLDVRFHDLIWDEPGSGLTYRFRFLAPQIAEGETEYETVAADMEALCTEYALPRLAGTGPQPGRIVITLMSEPVEFGVMTPDAVQFFESYSVDGAVCIWEAF
ncbi:DUF6497 family protein [Primorskyibacter sp. 2E107]